MFTDTHVHFDEFQRREDLPEVLARAAAAGVTRLLAIGGDSEANDLAVSLVRAGPPQVAAVVGYNRDQAGLHPSPARLAAALGKPGVVGLGEIGLDYHHVPETAEEQRQLFSGMLARAREAGLPVVVHSREADADTIQALEEHARLWGGARDRLGVLHCFTGDLAFAGRLLDLGLHISFSGIVTFASAASLREVCRHVPEERLLIETDSPYLAPVPHRGRPNEPAFVAQVAAQVAELRGVTVERIAEVTTRNAVRLFGLGE